MVPKKGLEPPHPCGYMDLNHARLPIPPLRQVVASNGSSGESPVVLQTSIFLRAPDLCQTSALKREVVADRDRNEAIRPSALSSERTSNAGAYNPSHLALAKAMERIMGLPSKLPPPLQTRLRALAHDLSNSLETIMQASYLLGQKPLGVEEKKWVELIEDAAQDAAQINRELREMLRG